MAKEKKAAKAEKETKTKTEAAPEFKYGVEDVADALDLKPASVRVQLRNRGIKKAGKSYGWNTKADLQEVIDELKTEKPAKKASKKEAADEKPAKGKAKAGKATKAAKGKKSKKDEDDD